MAIRIEERGNVREVTDDMNPRIYSVEYKCKGCGLWVPEDETVWIDKDTKEASTGDNAEPWHVDCAPEQEE